jgi:hypothetical protein
MTQREIDKLLALDDRQVRQRDRKPETNFRKRYRYLEEFACRYTNISASPTAYLSFLSR